MKNGKKRFGIEIFKCQHDGDRQCPIDDYRIPPSHPGLRQEMETSRFKQIKVEHNKLQGILT